MAAPATPLPPAPAPASSSAATTGRQPRRRAREVSSRYLSTPAPPSPRNYPSTPSPSPFADENRQPSFRPASPSGRNSRAAVKLFDDTAASRRRVPPLQPPRRGYSPRPPTPVRESWSSDSSSHDSLDHKAAHCDSPPLLGSKAQRNGSELRSSMPEASAERIRHGDNTEHAMLCHRSLNSALSACQPQHLPAAAAPTSKTIGKPPMPGKAATATPMHTAPDAQRVKVVRKKKEAVASTALDLIHELRMAENRYLQWRYINAKADSVAKAREFAAGKSLSEAAAKVAVLRDLVAEKRGEVERQRRDQQAHSIVTAQMPHLDEWDTLQVDHFACLSAISRVLQDASLRLPISGDVKADVNDLKEAFNYAIHTVNALSPNVENLLGKAEDVEGVASNLAKVIADEKLLAEECGSLISCINTLQVKESSLRSQLIQLKQNSESPNALQPLSICCT